jgi:hypothetical protein
LLDELQGKLSKALVKYDSYKLLAEQQIGELSHQIDELRTESEDLVSELSHINVPADVPKADIIFPKILVDISLAEIIELLGRKRSGENVDTQIKEKIDKLKINPKLNTKAKFSDALTKSDGYIVSLEPILTESLNKSFGI